MKPVEFKECNTVYAENQPEYFNLPAYVDKEGKSYFCWKLTFKERLKLLFTGRLWHSVWTFHMKLQPQCLSVDRMVFTVKQNEEH